MNAYWTIPVLAAIAGCTDTQAPAPPANTGPTVYAVNYPLQYMARRIGGDVVDVLFPCPAGVDPADWRPDDATVEACQEADLILLNGADYARWTRAASLPPSRLVDTSASFRDDYIETERGLTHGHGPDGEHTHGRIAFTTWLDPVQAIAQASAIRDAFVSRWPEHSAGFEAGFESLRADLASLDDRLGPLLAAADRPVLFAQPVYQYLARRYGLDAVSFHWEPDEMPADDQWQLVASQPATLMIWETQPDAAIARRLESLGITSVVFSPCANTPDDGDFLSVMEANLRNLGES